MPQFTSIPRPYAPLAEPVRYAVRQDDDTPGDLLVRIAAADGTLLGAKRFVAAATAEFDIAPIVRRAVRFAPTDGDTGFRPADDRMASVVVSVRTSADSDPAPEAAAAAPPAVAAAPSAAAVPSAAPPSAGVSDLPSPASDDLAVETPACPLLASRESLSGPALLSTMPAQRLLAPGECDELTLWSDAPLSVTVIARQGDTAAAHAYRTAAGGLHLFRLAADDFLGAESLTVDAGPCGTVSYLLTPLPEGSVRLAWRTAAGSVEHYTFPAVRSMTVEGDKRRIRSPEGLAATAGRAERRLCLESAFERPEVLEALAELTASVQVWRVDGQGYTPIDAVTRQAVIDRRDALGTLSVEIRSTRNDAVPWS